MTTDLDQWFIAEWNRIGGRDAPVPVVTMLLIEDRLRRLAQQHIRVPMPKVTP